MSENAKICGQCEDFTRYGQECFICHPESESIEEGCEVAFDSPACLWFKERSSSEIKFVEKVGCNHEKDTDTL